MRHTSSLWTQYPNTLDATHGLTSGPPWPKLAVLESRPRRLPTLAHIHRRAYSADVGARCLHLGEHQQRVWIFGNEIVCDPYGVGIGQLSTGMWLTLARSLVDLDSQTKAGARESASLRASFV